MTWNDFNFELKDGDADSIVRAEIYFCGGDVAQVFITSFNEKENKVDDVVEYYISKKALKDIVIPIHKAHVCNGCNNSR